MVFCDSKFRVASVEGVRQFAEDGGVGGIERAELGADEAIGETPVNRYELAAGELTRLAKFREGRGAHFNPHVLRPHLDQARERLVLFDTGSVVRVLDSGDGPPGWPSFSISVCGAWSVAMEATVLSPTNSAASLYEYRCQLCQRSNVDLIII